MPSTGDIVLFFHADRCPTCQEAEKNFLASHFPDNLTILKVDYDTETALKAKYRILTQTSFVYIKPDGELIKRWIGGLTLDDVLGNISDAKASLNQSSAPAHKSILSSGSIQATAYFAG